MAINTQAYVENYLKIVNKESELVPFKFNKPQQRLYNIIKEQYELGNPIRIIILKARQMGFSTFVEGIGFKDISTNHNRRMAIVTHEEKATSNLYRMTRRYYDNLIPELQPKTKSYNGYGIEYEQFKSSVVCYTAGGSSIGRSDTFHILHASEVAFWPGDKKVTLNGLLQAVPKKFDTLVFLESTANGFDYFKDLWDGAVAGENGYIPFFAAWYELEEYVDDATGFVLNEDISKYGDEKLIMETYNLTLEQMAWRRNKIKEPGNDLALFKQEYPSNPLEAFMSSGDSIFNKEQVIGRLEYVKKHIKALKQGRFHYQTYIDQDSGVVRILDDTIKWEDDPTGEIKIFEEPEVIKTDTMVKRAPYVIGGDTAGTGEDYFTAKVINNITKKDAAIYYKQKVDEGIYAEQIYCLHKYYHDALVGIETNYSVYPTRRLMELHVRQYSRENLDSLKASLDQLGFKTTQITRPNMISHFKDIIRDDISIILDEITLQEMLVFVRDKNGKAQAEDGKHDDMIMATMITHKIAYQQTSDYEVDEEDEVDIIEEFFKGNNNSKKVDYDQW
ncbi:MAG: hypothetical protein AB7E61_07195 [Acholeplasmataceae bacterium]